MALRQTFKAMVVSETHEKTFEREIKERDLAALPPGELLIEVKYSSLNYKDALSASGNKGITKKYPHTLGVDAAGVVLGCSNRTFAVGDEVIVTGFDLGMNTPGGIRPVHQRSGELGTQGAAGSVAERDHGLWDSGFNCRALRHETAGSWVDERTGRRVGYRSDRRRRKHCRGDPRETGL